MGIKQITTKKFIEFLQAQGLEFLRRVDSHDHYNNPVNPLSRDIIIRGKNKDIPRFHIHTNLQTLGISKAEFEQLIAMKKIPNVSALRTKPVKLSLFRIVHSQNGNDKKSTEFQVPSKGEAIKQFKQDYPLSSIIKIVEV